MNPIGYWAGALPGTTDANILVNIQEQFGSRLEELNRDDKAWLLAQQLSPSNQIALSVAKANQLLFGGHN